jgi:FdhD protein
VHIEESPLVRRFDVRRFRASGEARVWDNVALEEPLEIHLRYWIKEIQLVQSLGLTMRTPGNDRELVLGLLVAEGIILNRHDVIDIRHLGSGESSEILVELSKGVDVETWRLARTGFVNSSCGVCGKRDRAAIAEPASGESNDELRVDAQFLARLPSLLREQQEAFAMTGGLHAAALVTRTGTILRAFEDVGRHNALDKLIGWSVAEDLLPLRDYVLLMSSRSSFELIQKMAMAGGVMMVTVGAASSLAIETAREYGMTLIGFIKEEGFNVYSGDWRINS